MKQPSVFEKLNRALGSNAISEGWQDNNKKIDLFLSEFLDLLEKHNCEAKVEVTPDRKAIIIFKIGKEATAMDSKGVMSDEDLSSLLKKMSI